MEIVKAAVSYLSWKDWKS